MHWYEAKAMIEKLTNGVPLTNLEERELIAWIERTNLTNAQRALSALQKSEKQ